MDRTCLKGIKEGVRLAKSIDAKVTGLCVMPFRIRFSRDGDPTQALDQASIDVKSGGNVPAAIEKEAKKMGVACVTVMR